MSELNHFGVLRGQVTLPDIYECVVVPNVPLKCVMRVRYDTKQNKEGPDCTWPDAIYDGVVLNDEMSLQMFEQYVSTNPQIRAYDCHIASAALYDEHKKNPNNFVYASWNFHNYFDGLKVNPKGIPPMLIRLVMSYVAKDIEVNGNRYPWRRIDVIMDFMSVKGCEEMCRTLRPGFIMINTTQVRTWIYSKDPEEMCHFFSLKYQETVAKWGIRNRYVVPPQFTVRHGCPYPSE
jgi:hypothetical protein